VACHKEQHAQWSTTNHVRAWQALASKDRTMDQDCWSCHVTAANVAGGPTDPASTVGFHDVQCEACHGPGRAHAVQPQANTLVKTPGPEVCVRCHDGKRDGGRFDFESYRARISH
jgi:predicted CXXCH cytochrome family protein